MKSCDLDQALHEHFSEEELAGHFHVLLWTFLQWHCYHTQYLSKRLVRKLYCSSSSKFPNCIVEPIARFILSSFQKPFTGEEVEEVEDFQDDDEIPTII